MLRTTFGYVALLGCVVLAASVWADDKKADKDTPAVSGVWVQKGGEVRIDFSAKDVMRVAPHGNDVLVVVCSYTSEKKGVVKATITGYEGKDEAKEKAKEKLPVGLEFRFTWQVKDDRATFTELKGDKVEILKAHLEGDYEKKK